MSTAHLRRAASTPALELLLTRPCTADDLGTFVARADGDHSRSTGRLVRALPDYVPAGSLLRKATTSKPPRQLGASASRPELALQAAKTRFVIRSASAAGVPVPRSVRQSPRMTVTPTAPRLMPAAAPCQALSSPTPVHGARRTFATPVESPSKSFVVGATSDSASARNVGPSEPPGLGLAGRLAARLHHECVVDGESLRAVRATLIRLLAAQPLLRSLDGVALEAIAASAELRHGDRYQRLYSAGAEVSAHGGSGGGGYAFLLLHGEAECTETRARSRSEPQATRADRVLPGQLCGAEPLAAPPQRTPFDPPLRRTQHCTLTMASVALALPLRALSVLRGDERAHGVLSVALCAQLLADQLPEADARSLPTGVLLELSANARLQRREAGSMLHMRGAIAQEVLCLVSGVAEFGSGGAQAPMWQFSDPGPLAARALLAAGSPGNGVTHDHDARIGMAGAALVISLPISTTLRLVQHSAPLRGALQLHVRQQEHMVHHQRRPPSPPSAPPSESPPSAPPAVVVNPSALPPSTSLEPNPTDWSRQRPASALAGVPSWYRARGSIRSRHALRVAVEGIRQEEEGVEMPWTCLLAVLMPDSLDASS